MPFDGGFAFVCLADEAQMAMILSEKALAFDGIILYNRKKDVERRMTMNSAMKKRYDLLGPCVAEACRNRHFEAYYCSNREEVLPLVLSLIPKAHTVAWGGSETLAELGVIDAVKANGYAVIDRDKAGNLEERMHLMREALLSDTFLMSANAVSEDGVLVNVDGNGNRVAAMMFGPKSVIVIVGMNKVVRDTDAAVQRARTLAAPMNSQRFPTLQTPCKKTGACADCKSADCICSYVTVTRMSRPAGRIKVIFVGESLGF